MSQQNEVQEDLVLLDETCTVENKTKYVWKLGNRKISFNQPPKLKLMEQICTSCKHRSNYEVVVNVPSWYRLQKIYACVNCGEEETLSNFVEKPRSVIYVGTGWAINENAFKNLGAPQSIIDAHKHTKL